jgi:hypothetical protein
MGQTCKIGKNVCATLEELIHNHPDNAVFPNAELIKSMGFPANWQDAAALPM